MKIHTLDKDLVSGRQCIECLTALLRRLLPLERSEWLEQTLVTRVYLTGKYPQTQGADGVKNMRRLLDGTKSYLWKVFTVDVRRGLVAPLSNKTTCSVQMVRTLGF